jgi:streptogramin lyase
MRKAPPGRQLLLERLEDRTVLSGFTEFPVPHGGPFDMTLGADGNVWFTEEYTSGNRIGRITPAGVVSEFPIPTANSAPFGIALGPDGNVWFGEAATLQLGRITPAGTITEFPGLTGQYVGVAAGPGNTLWVTEETSNQVALVSTSGTILSQFTVPTPNSGVGGGASGPDGALWFIEYFPNKIGRLTPDGTFTEYAIPTPNSGPVQVVVGPDGNVWFTESIANKIGRMTPTGVFTEFSVPTPNSGAPFSGAEQLTVGPDGNIWFVEPEANQIARVTPSGVVTEFPIPTPNSGATSIVTGSDGNIWFTERNANQIGRFTPGPGPYVVHTTADSGPGSLRDAINQINADTTHTLYPSPSNPNVDEIDFNITAASDTGGGYNPATGVATITPLSGLPDVTNAVLIDGYTQAGAKTNDLSGPGQLGVAPADPATYGDDAILKIELDGTSAGTVTGLSLAAKNITVQGLVINRFSDAGIRIGGTGDVLQGNFLGTDVTGTQALGNTGADVNAFQGPKAMIGGTTPMARNIISGALPGTYPQIGGIVLGGDNSTVQGNFIGTDVTGTRSLGNAYEGIYMFCANCLIGGPTPGAGNLISGNGDYGVFEQNSYGNTFEGNFIGTDVTGTNYVGNARFGIFGQSVTAENYGKPGAGNLILSAKGGIKFNGDNNLIQGNLIGTDVTGTKLFGNGGPGIQQDDGNNNVIGGQDTNAPGQPLAGAGNVISGNDNGGILLFGGPVTLGDLVAGNYIGTDITGTQAFPNFGAGVQLGAGATNVTIGGTNSTYRNVISGTTLGDGYGILIGRLATTGVIPSNNVVEGNYIGTDATGTVALGNRVGVVIDVSINNVIGGTANGAGNTIANNITGVFVGDPSGPDSITNGNAILGNSIYANSDVAIRHQNGVNSNFPFSNLVLTAASSSSNGTTVSGAVTSAAGIPFRVEFFANPALDPSGSGQGQTYLGFATMTTDSSGNATFTATGLAPLPAGQAVLSATLTDLATNATGGFCHDGVVAVAGLTSSANSSVYGQPVTFTAAISGYAAGFGTPSGSVDFVDTTTNTDLGTVALSGGSATLTTSALTAGAHDIEAVYGGDSIFLGTSTTVSQAVGKAHLTVTANPASKSEGQAFDPSTFSGTISGLQNGDAITAAFSSTGDPAGADAGTYAISAVLSDEGSGQLALDYVVDSNLSDVGILTVNDTPVSNLALALAASPINEGSSVSLSGSFTNPSAVDVNTLVINWGDASANTTVNLAAGVTTFSGISHQYLEESAGQPGGGFPISVTVSDGEGGQSNAQTSVQVTDAPLSDQTNATAVSAAEGASTGDQVVGTFADADPNATPGDYTATISWGDNTSSAASAVALSGGLFSVHGAHTYAEEGTYHPYAVVIDNEGNPNLTTGSSVTTSQTLVTVNVADAPLSARGVTVTPVTGTAFTGVVATFTDGDAGGTATDYQAITWGDGHTSAGTVAANGQGGFSVSGTNTYAADGTFATTVTITDAGGSSTAAHGTAYVGGVARRFSVTATTAATAGTAFAVTVAVLDASGNPAYGYVGTVHFTSTDASAALPADYTFTAADLGTQVFSTTLKTASTQSVSATDTTTGLTGKQAGIVVSAGAVRQFQVVPASTTVTLGKNVNVTVTAQDAYGNTVSNYQGTVSLSISPGYNFVVSPASHTFTSADAGKYTFSVVFYQTGLQTVTANDTAGITGTATIMVPLTITNVTASQVSSSGALISWVTNGAASSQVFYRIAGTSGPWLATPVPPALVTSHEVQLTGLPPRTKYEFYVESIDPTGQTVDSAISTFRTLR